MASNSPLPRKTPHKVPTEIVINITIYAAYEDLLSLCLATGRLTFSQAKYHHYNPRRYLLCLIRSLYNSDILLAAMRDTSTSISGLRAAGLFYPLVSREGSDWDFYCSGGDVAVARFTSLLHTHLGALWQSSSYEPEFQPVPNQSTYDGTFQILHGELNGHKLHVMWYRQMRHGVFDTILEFHSSIVQCFISGWCAVSLYHQISKNDRMVAWVKYPSKKTKAPQCVAKYQNRGFELVPYQRKLVRLKEEFFGFCTGTNWLLRCVADEGCLVIDFSSYLRPEFVSHGKSIATPMQRAVMQEIMALRWGEGGDLGTELMSS